MTQLEPGKQVKAWHRILKDNEDKPITAEVVNGVVKKMLGQPGKTAPKAKSAAKKTEQKLMKIGKLVTETLEKSSGVTVAQLKKTLEKIRKMIGATQ